MLEKGADPNGAKLRIILSLFFYVLECIVSLVLKRRETSLRQIRNLFREI